MFIQKWTHMTNKETVQESGYYVQTEKLYWCSVRMSERNLFWFEACDINVHINPITLFSVHVNNQSEWIQSDWTTNCLTNIRNRKTIMWRFDLFYHGFCPSFICYLPFSFFQFREWVHIYSLEWSEPALVWGELSSTVSLELILAAEFPCHANFGPYIE